MSGSGGVVAFEFKRSAPLLLLLLRCGDRVAPEAGVDGEGSGNMGAAL